MKLQTTIAVQHIDVENILTGGNKSSKVTMDIGDFSFGAESGISIPFTYTDAAGNILPTKHNGVFPIPKADVKALSKSINSLLPETDNIEDRFWSEVKIIAINEMMSSFGIEASKIKEV